MQPLVFHPVNTISQGQVDNAQNLYSTNVGQAQQAQNNLETFRKGMTDPSQMYQTNLNDAEGQFGFNPQELKNAQMALANTQTTMANLPQAVQQQGNYYGTTAGQQANGYAQQAGNLQGVLAGQGNAVNALGNLFTNILQQSGQKTQFGVQGQQMQLDTLQKVYTNAADMRNSALSQLQNLQDLFQKQGQFNAAEQADYVQANAALQQANAAMLKAQAQAANLNAQTQAIEALNGSPLGASGTMQRKQDIQSYLHSPAASSPIPQAGFDWNLGDAIGRGQNFVGSLVSKIPGIGAL